MLQLANRSFARIVCRGLQTDPIDALAEPLPALDFVRSRYGCGFMLAERIGFLWEEVAATMTQANSGRLGWA